MKMKMKKEEKKKRDEDRRLHATRNIWTIRNQSIQIKFDETFFCILKANAQAEVEHLYKLCIVLGISYDKCIDNFDDRSKYVLEK